MFWFVSLLLGFASCQTQTLVGKLFCGYQGWFTTPGDGFGLGWNHYKVHSDQPFSRANAVIDFWPETDEYPVKYAVPELGPNIYAFSANDYSTVQAHFRWMAETGIDGVFLQRFGTQIKDRGSPIWNNRRKVMENVQNAARERGKYWAIMYDLTGLQPGQIRSGVMEDWKYVMTQFNIRNDPFYVRHQGKPVVVVYGLGFNDFAYRKYTIGECVQLINFLKNGQFGGNSVIIGTPRYWREGGKDTVTGDQLVALHNAIQISDGVLPWTVGRYSTVAAAQADAENIVKADVTWCNQRKLTLMPVIWPGFSWHNLQTSVGGNPGPYDQIPRKQNGVYFLAAQGQSVVKAGARTVFVAMFDQMNEGTAIFKNMGNPPSMPDGLRFVGQEGPNVYMNIAGNIARTLKMAVQEDQTEETI